VLVPSVHALQLRGDEGYEDVPVREALWSFDGMDRRPSWELRAFAAKACLPRVYLRETSDRQLLDMLREATRRGWLVALRKGDGAGKTTSETAERRRLVRQIEQQTRGKLSYAGRQYKLVVDVDLAGTPNRDGYEVASRGEARRVLNGLAQQSGSAGDLAGLLGQASAKLTPDWRSPIQPDGLILLRRTVVQAATKPDDGPAVTPSQLRKLKSGWITIEVEDDFGLPWQGKLHLVLEDGARDVATDSEGVVHLQNIAPGNVDVSIADLDAKAWDKK